MGLGPPGTPPPDAQPGPCVHSGELGGWRYCSTSCPCAAGEGDCDDDSECEPGLKCVRARGAAYGFRDIIDVCDVANADVLGADPPPVAVEDVPPAPELTPGPNSGLPPCADSVSPPTPLAATAPATLWIIGSNLHPDATVTFVDPDKREVTCCAAAPPVWESSTRIRTEVALVREDGRHARDGMWSVRVTNPDGSQAPVTSPDGSEPCSHEFFVSGGWRLPFPGGTTFAASQGSMHHGGEGAKNYYAIDFGLKDGDPIVAAQAGVVSVARDDFREGKCSDSHLNLGNRVVLNHPDGTASLYLHLEPDSIPASVTPGTSVARGQCIGRAGHTGKVCSQSGEGTGAHLHFQRQAVGSWWTQSEPVYFEELHGGQPETNQLLTSENQAVLPCVVTAPALSPEPGVDRVSPPTPSASKEPATLSVIGSNFHPDATVTFVDPSGTEVACCDAGPPVWESSTSIRTLFAFGSAGEWSVRVTNSDGQRSPWRPFTVAATAGQLRQVLAPVHGPLWRSCIWSENRSVWDFCQGGSSGHRLGGGYCKSDDTLAFDINLPLSLDTGRPVYAVARGDVVAWAGNGTGGKWGIVLIKHGSDTAPWWSGYLHMTDIEVEVGDPVTTSTRLGRIGDIHGKKKIDPHLHFAVYEGSNHPVCNKDALGKLVSKDVQFVERQ